MTDNEKLKQPWLVAVWPGMGGVAVQGGYYLMAKLGMHLLSEISARELFDVEHIEVKKGLIHTGRLPRSRFYLWKDPRGRRDLIVFIGEAQPPTGKRAFCDKLMEYARDLGVERVYSFAAMATQMHPEQASRVFCAATNQKVLEELKETDMEVLEDGHIGGLNGVVLGAAVENGMDGVCLLGELPHIFSQLPYPKATLAVLEAFKSLAGIDLDLAELVDEVEIADKKLGKLLASAEEAIRKQRGMGEEGFGVVPEVEEEEKKLSSEARRHIEKLFEQAKQDRSVAYELKRELDKCDVFSEYEDRFLELFREGA